MASADEQRNNLPILLASSSSSSSVSDSDEEEQEHVGFTDDFSIPTPNPYPISNPNYNPTPPSPPIRRTPGGLFQRLWTDGDEIVILEGFLDFVTERGTTHANYQHDTGPFYDRIRGRIPLDFNKSQLLEKLRRLKKKYRTVAARIGSSCAGGEDSFAFRTSHERRVYDIARKIWSSSLKKRPRGRHSNGGDGGGAADEERRVRRRDGHVEVPVVLEREESRSVVAPVLPLVSSVVEATVRCCLSPLFEELGKCGANGASGGVCLESRKVFSEDDERWKEQQILELEVYLKRMELLEEQIRYTLDELRSTMSIPGSAETVVAS